MNRNDSQGLAIVARPDKSLNRHFVATSQLAPPGSAVGTALSSICIQYPFMPTAGYDSMANAPVLHPDNYSSTKN